MEEELGNLFAAVCGFTGELLTDVRAVTLGEYLEAGLGRAVPDETLAQWRAAR
jgi:hypothetical protein